jgi:hypothetical protein
MHVLSPIGPVSRDVLQNLPGFGSEILLLRAGSADRKRGRSASRNLRLGWFFIK